MPRRTPSSTSNPFFQERSVVAQEDGADGSWCPCILSLTFDKADDDGNDPDKTGAPRQGIVTLQPQCQYPFKGHESRIPVSLRVPLENLKSVSRRFTTVGDMSPAITHHLSRKHSIRRRAQVLTLTLTISSPGSVIVPLTVSKLTPKTEDQKPIQAFQRLCRSTKIMIHTYVPEGTEIPEAMLDSIGRLAGQKGMLMSLPAGLASLYNGRGARETTWEVFDLPDELPPAYTPRPGQTKSKRARTDSPDSPPKKRLTGYSKAIIPDPAGCISKTNSPTNLSAPAVSPLPTFPDASSKPKARPDESAKSPAPIAAAEGSFPSVVRDAVQNAVREMLPALLEATLLEMLPNVILPVVREQFPDVAEQYLEDEDIVGEAQFAVSEEKEDALIEIHEEKNKVLKEVLEEISEKRENAVNEVDEGVESGYMRLLQTEETAIRKIEGAAKKIMTDLERVEALHRRWKEDQEMQVLKRAGDVSKIGSQSVKGKQELGNMIKADEQASESTKGSVVDPLRFQRVRRSARSSGGRSVGGILSNSTAQQGEWGKAARGNDTGKEAHSVAEAQRYVGRAAPRVSSEDTTETESYCGSEDGLAYEGHRPTAIILDTATDKSDPVEDAAVQAQAQESRRLPHPESPGKNSGVMSGGSEDEGPEGEGQPGPGGRMHERYGWVPESIELSATQANTEVDADCTPESGLVEGTDMDSEL